MAVLREQHVVAALGVQPDAVSQGGGQAAGVRPCGVCDNCRSLTAPVADANALEEMAVEIRSALANAAMSPRDLAARFEGREERLRSAVEGLRKEGKLSMDEDGRLVWKG